MKIVFDVETNGFYPMEHSVLSFSALLVDKNFEIVEELDRYYYLRDDEKPNAEAIRINGLNEKAITEKRGNANYPKHFHEDKKDIINFINQADTLIAHNIEFDYNFLVYNMEQEFPHKQICTMLMYQYLYEAPYEKNGEPKYPKLIEAMFFLKKNNVKLHPRLKNGNFHNSLYDCYCALELFRQPFINIGK